MESLNSGHIWNWKLKLKLPIPVELKVDLVQLNINFCLSKNCPHYISSSLSVSTHVVMIDYDNLEVKYYKLKIIY